ncbi:hypothetical protein GTW51_00995 [Aurantimonas aggregata]|uniref:Uncharacterized protein n=1 Tax=Aurantimonas aggregata TaxID=2047720 RepID=A0A6L9MC56_9HYPH|nr:hypothetical protein [Aurantimonas aggregata]NDV85271.1 hypothetical protein [Aurantimonas aggregata]
MSRLHELLPVAEPVRRMPACCATDALTGGIDLAATLAAGRPVSRAGLLATADQGVLVAAMAERMAPQACGLLVQCLDTGVVRIERDGLSAEIRRDPGADRPSRARRGHRHRRGAGKRALRPAGVVDRT